MIWARWYEHSWVVLNPRTNYPPAILHIPDGFRSINLAAECTSRSILIAAITFPEGDRFMNVENRHVTAKITV